MISPPFRGDLLRASAGRRLDGPGALRVGGAHWATASEPRSGLGRWRIGAPEQLRDGKQAGLGTAPDRGSLRGNLYSRFSPTGAMLREGYPNS